VVRVSVDLDVAADSQLSWGDEFVVLVHVLVLVSAQEWALDDATVLDSGLVDRDAIVSEVERDDKSSFNILRHARVETSVVAKDLFVVIDRLEEVTFGLLGDQVVDIAESVNFISKTVIWRNLALSWLGSFWHLNSSNSKVSSKLGHKELLS